MVTTTEIAELVKDNIEDIPETVDSGTNIKNWVEQGKIHVQNYTGDIITNSDVTEKYQAVLFNIGCAYTLSKMVGTGVDFDAKIGEFDVKKGTRETPQSRQAKMHIEFANNDLRNLGHHIGSLYAKVNG